MTTYKTGPAYPAAGYGIIFFLIILGALLMLFFPLNVAKIIGGIFFLYGVYLITIRRSLLVHENQYKFLRKTIFGSLGKWNNIEESDVLVVKYVLLSDRKHGRVGIHWGPFLPFGVGMFGDDRGMTTQAWTVSIKRYGEEKVKLLTSTKTEVLRLINQILEEKYLEVYSGVYKEDRKLNRNELKKGNLVFIKKPKTVRRR